MQILIYSNSIEAVEQLQIFCRELELPKPRLLGAIDIDTKLAGLVAADAALADCTMENDVSDLSEPVILFYRPEKPALTGMIRKYKDAGQWPYLRYSHRPLWNRPWRHSSRNFSRTAPANRNGVNAKPASSC